MGWRGRGTKSMKKHEAATVSMEQKKTAAKKCQQPIAAGLCCRRRHGLCFPRATPPPPTSPLHSPSPRCASSFHPIKCARGLTAHNWASISPLRLKEADRRGEKRMAEDKSNGLMRLCGCVCVCVHFQDGPLGEPQLRVCQFCVSACRLASAPFVIQWHRHSAATLNWRLMVFVTLRRRTRTRCHAKKSGLNLCRLSPPPPTPVAVVTCR